MTLTNYIGNLIPNSSHPSLNFSTPVDWADLTEHLAKFGKEIDQVPGDGKCFIEFVKHCLKHDLGIALEDHDIRNLTLQEMVQRIDFYH